MKRFDEMLLIPSFDCNAQCPYCHQTCLSNAPIMCKEITPEHVSSYIEFIEREVEGMLVFYGGEPLMHFHDFIKPICDHFSKENRFMAVISNGILLKGEIREYIKQHMNLVLSYDGYIEGSTDYKTSKHGKVRFEELVEFYSDTPDGVRGITLSPVVTRDNLFNFENAAKEHPEVSRRLLLHMNEHFTKSEIEYIMAVMDEHYTDASLLHTIRTPFHQSRVNIGAAYGNGRIMLNTPASVPAFIFDKLIVGENFQIDEEKFRAMENIARRLNGIKDMSVCKDCYMAPACLSEKETFEEYQALRPLRSLSRACLTSYIASILLQKRGISPDRIKLPKGRI